MRTTNQWHKTQTLETDHGIYHNLTYIYQQGRNIFFNNKYMQIYFFLNRTLGRFIFTYLNKR